LDNETFKCSSCGKEIGDSGLCVECLKHHDRVVKFCVLIIWILAIISFAFYYVLFIQ